jgi:hypothetical protein
MRMNFLKALIPGSLLTWIVSSLIGRSGGRGGMLEIHRIVIEGHAIAWSWPLFIAAVGLAWLMFALTD